MRVRSLFLFSSVLVLLAAACDDSTSKSDAGGSGGSGSGGTIAGNDGSVDSDSGAGQQRRGDRH
jgi:hypothetical protein